MSHLRSPDLQDDYRRCRWWCASGPSRHGSHGPCPSHTAFTGGSEILRMGLGTHGFDRFTMSLVFDLPTFSGLKSVKSDFFPRASERRVLPIVGVCISSSQLHTFSSSHLLIFTHSHLHIFSSSHLLIFTSSHLHIFSSWHLLIFTPSHLHIFSSSHLLIFTSAHLHICSSSHLLIFTSSHLHICSSSHLYLHILTPSLSLSLSHSLSPLSSLLSLSPFSLPFLSLAFFIFLSLGRGWCRRGVTKRELFRTKWWLIGENWGKIAILLVPEQPFRTKWGSIVKNWGKIASLLAPEQPFRTKWGSIVKNWGKIASLLVPEQPFRTKWWSIVKNWGKIAILLGPEQPFRTKWGSIVKNWGKIAILRVCV